MKNLKSLVAMPLLMLALIAFKADHPLLEFGAEAPMADRKMQAVDGKSYSINELKKEKGLLVIFSCNTCPFVLGWEDQYPKLKSLADENQIGMVLVNSNERKRDGDDSMAEMQKHAKEAGYTMPYVLDAKNELANAFGAKTTPHVYLFDGAMKLVYRGSINDKFENRSKEAEKMYLEGALKALGAGEKIDPADTRELGCSIKRL
ncbi:thioredoxin family protein [Croceimicrobium sp.]|uniref:thioredoxin family protein n=1 Tax=Croceimicrobium sp. TaxID=2828340 RepID=UPI003BACA2BC